MFIQFNRLDQEREEMRRKIFDIEEQMRRKVSSPAPVHASPYPSPVSHGRDDMQGILREKDSYIEQLKTEKYESVRNFEREKNRLLVYCVYYSPVNITGPRGGQFQHC